LYYTDLKAEAQISKEDGGSKAISINPQGKAILNIHIPANKWTWYVFQ
jgi:hypothetical protein